MPKIVIINNYFSLMKIKIDAIKMKYFSTQVNLFYPKIEISHPKTEVFVYIMKSNIDLVNHKLKDVILRLFLL